MTAAARFPSTGSLSLLLVARAGDSKLLKHLLEAGAEVETVDLRGMTAVQAAREYGHTALVAMLQRQVVKAIDKGS